MNVMLCLSTLSTVHGIVFTKLEELSMTPDILPCCRFGVVRKHAQVIADDTRIARVSSFSARSRQLSQLV